MTDLPSIEERCRRERELRKARSGRLLAFGVEYLDRALDGIAPNDLIIIGAPTGTGKTELVTHIAGTNAHTGRRVLFFPLEAEEGEIESRIKFKIATQLYYRNTDPNKTIVPDISYRNWYLNKLGKAFDVYEQQADQILARNFKTFKTIYRTGRDFKVQDFLGVWRARVSQDGAIAQCTGAKLHPSLEPTDRFAFC